MHRKYRKYKIQFINFFSFILWKKKNGLRFWYITTKKNDSFLALTPIKFVLPSSLPKACSFYFTLFTIIHEIVVAGFSWTVLFKIMYLYNCIIYSKQFGSDLNLYWYASGTIRFRLMFSCSSFKNFFAQSFRCLRFHQTLTNFEQTYMAQEGN